MTPLLRHNILRSIAVATTQDRDTGTVSNHYGQVPKAFL